MSERTGAQVMTQRVHFLAGLLETLTIASFFSASLLRIPAQAGQRFQPKLDSDSKASWTLIPAQAGQPKVIT